eukprot:8323514-Pyramimonas_sp.AAC.1
MIASRLLRCGEASTRCEAFRRTTTLEYQYRTTAPSRSTGTRGRTALFVAAAKRSKSKNQRKNSPALQEGSTPDEVEYVVPEAPPIAQDTLDTDIVNAIERAAAK